MINVKILTNDELNCLLVRLENELASRQSKVFTAITIGKDGRCQCNCANTCPLGKTGSALRCTKEELRDYL